MELTVKHFDELNTRELYEILKLRASVFVVEQNCPYQDLDDADLTAYHVYLTDETGIQAYARVLPKGHSSSEPSIGRVIAAKRRCGMGSRVVNAAVRVAKERFNAGRIVIEAQLYAQKFYENAGFFQTSPVFMLDGIEHIQMTRVL